MIKKTESLIFTITFLSALAIPLLTTNLKPNVISTAENRVLTQMPALYKEDGSLNTGFLTDFENWFNDNLGFRSAFVIGNARIQYYIFNQLADNSNMYLGPNGELNYATNAMLVDFQHLNLYSQEELDNIADSFQVVGDYLENRGIQLYYYQCWDKHSIYPEYFPDTVIQYGEMSKTDYVIEALKTKTDINVISSKENLISAKDKYETYSLWGDSTHWTQRGSYLGYLDLMNAINKANDGIYKVLDESDYNISLQDAGSTLFGGIHKINMSEQFEIINPKAYATFEKLTLCSDNPVSAYFTNDAAGNNTRVLIFGDSYFYMFLEDDLAESFYETILVGSGYQKRFLEIVDEYKPNIVIIENAERVDRFSMMVETANMIKENSTTR